MPQLERGLASSAKLRLFDSSRPASARLAIPPPGSCRMTTEPPATATTRSSRSRSPASSASTTTKSSKPRTASASASAASASDRATGLPPILGPDGKPLQGNALTNAIKGGIRVETANGGERTSRACLACRKLKVSRSSSLSPLLATYSRRLGISRSIDFGSGEDPHPHPSTTHVSNFHGAEHASGQGNRTRRARDRFQSQSRASTDRRLVRSWADPLRRRRRASVQAM